MPREIRITFKKGDNRFYHITYTRDTLPSGAKEMQRAPKHLQLSEFYANVSDVKTLWPNAGFSEAIANALINIVAWDVDKTLSHDHTWPGMCSRKPPLPITNNRRYPQKTDAILQTLRTRPNTQLIISSNGLRQLSDLPKYNKDWPQIVNFVNAWWPKGNPFHAVYGRQDYKSVPIHKIWHMRQHYDRLSKQYHFPKNGSLLSLNTLKQLQQGTTYLDVVSACLIDDTQRVGSIAIDTLFNSRGMDFIWASPGDAYLNTINQYFQLGLELDLIKDAPPVTVQTPEKKQEKENVLDLSESGSLFSTSGSFFSGSGSDSPPPSLHQSGEITEQLYPLRSSSPLEEVISLRNSLVLSR